MQLGGYVEGVFAAVRYSYQLDLRYVADPSCQPSEYTAMRMNDQEPTSCLGYEVWSQHPSYVGKRRASRYLNPGQAKLGRVATAGPPPSHPAGRDSDVAQAGVQH